VKQVLAAGVAAMLLGILSGPAFIAFLRRNEFGQQIREEGPAGHMSKQGTPTLGGLVLLACTMISFLFFTRRTTPGLAVAGTMLACAAIGFVDDYLKLTNRRSLGLSGRWKMLGLAAVVAGLAVVAHHEHLSTDVYLPVIDTHVPLGPGYYVFIFLVVGGAANAVNLTDGLDGLAAGTMTIAALTYSAMGVVAFLAAGGLYSQSDPRSLDLAILAAALVGGCVGFLWYNAYPADVFMGDTGAFGLGGGLAALAVFTKTEVLLVIIGGVFVIEALSVVIQVVAFRTTGRRVFLMAPIHHHFEMMEWTENKIIVRFWIMAAIFGASGFVLYYLFFSKYR
jgi:phospho-N-acetylmuramoyl-pentapeptide-transferase